MSQSACARDISAFVTPTRLFEFTVTVLNFETLLQLFMNMVVSGLKGHAVYLANHLFSVTHGESQSHVSVCPTG